jgi:hypothetical protein
MYRHYIPTFKSEVFPMPKHQAVKLNRGHGAKLYEFLASVVDYSVSFTRRLFHPNKFSLHSHWMTGLVNASVSMHLAKNKKYPYPYWECKSKNIPRFTF